MRARVSGKAGLAALFVVVGLAGLTALSGCGGSSDAPVVRGEMARAIDEYLTAITPYGFSGALLVASGGEVVLRKGYGLADDSEGVPNTVGTVFTTGSVTKQFTAAAILRLEMDGLLSTDDPLADHLDGVPGDKAGVTLHHLLTHTSGVVGSTGDDFEEVGRDEVVRRIMEAPLAFEPGTEMSYSNAGYSLLAAVVERASGLSYEEYVRDALFEPSGMKQTGYRLPDWDESKVARWYDGGTDNGTLLEKAYPHWNLLGNGGIQSTLGDMFLWYEALKGETVLSEEAKAKLWTPYLDDYACGWDVLETDEGRLIQHDGGSSLGASAEFRWFVDEDLLIVLFCNRSYHGFPLFEMVRSEIRELASGGAIELPPPAVDVGPELTESVRGSYILPSGGGLHIRDKDGTLTITTFDQDGVNALFQPEADPDTYDDLNAKSGRLIAAAVSGNADVFTAELGEGDLARRVHRMLAGHIARFAEMSGSPPAASIALGTIPHGDDGTAITGMRIKTVAGESDDLSLWWRDGSLIGIDTRAFQVSIPLVFASETRLIGYHLGFAKVHTIDFELHENGRPASMRFGSRVAENIALPGPGSDRPFEINYYEESGHSHGEDACDHSEGGEHDHGDGSEHDQGDEKGGS